jgi:hypothetical protein
LKRILLPAGGAVLATGLLAAGLAGSAQATPTVASDPMAGKPADAVSIAKWWLANNSEALKKATEYQWDSKNVTKLVSGGGYTPDGKPGLTAPIGYEGTKAAKVKNINLPKTIGKVFFVNKKGETHWCSATSIQSKYRNLVATAGHCVYDIAGNGDVLDKWVFVPGYYQGKTPWGIYVGKQAFTHYDFDNYEDFDRDYAFVTVYNGFTFDGEKEVSYKEFQAWTGDKYEKEDVVDAATYDRLRGQGYFGKSDDVRSTDLVGPNHADAKPVAVEVDKWTFEKGAKLPNDITFDELLKGEKKDKWPVAGTQLYTKELNVTQTEYDSYKGLGYKNHDTKGNYTITEYFVVKYVKESTAKKYVIYRHYIQKVADKGTLGSNVGGQGFAWNQKTGQPTWVFGYPAQAHADGNKPYTGITPKWCYSKKPSGKTFASAANKAEEHIALKCAMTGGADGGPWLIKYSNAKRLGYVNGVTSLFHDQDGNSRTDYISSPYFDGETAAVYAKAANTWSGKIVGANGEILK